MSKRHRKPKTPRSIFDDDIEDTVHGQFGYMEFTRGKKPRGKNKRQSMKRAYYD